MKTKRWFVFAGDLQLASLFICSAFLAGPAQAQTPAPADRGITLPIHRAAGSGNIDALIPLVEATNTLNAHNEQGLTPLVLAFEKGYLSAVALLVDSGADVNARDADGNTVLQRYVIRAFPFIATYPPSNWIARMGRDPRKARYLEPMAHNAHPDWPQPPDGVVMETGFLLACGADPSATNRAGQTAMQLAMDPNSMLFDNRTPILKLLVSAGADTGSGDANGDTPLHLSGREAFGERTASLIAAGADINATNHQGQTPLHKYVEYVSGLTTGGGTNTPIEWLLAARPNVNAQDNDGCTPLHVLALSDSSFKREATSLILAAGANPNLRDKQGRTPAECFLAGKWPWSGAAQCLPLLVKAGADFSIKDNDGKTLLHYLASLGPLENLTLLPGFTDSLMAAKPDLNPRDNDGNTPLHLAAKFGTTRVFDWLAQSGADLDATNHLGETPRLLKGRNPARGFPGLPPSIPPR